MGASRSEFCRAGQQAGNSPARANVAVLKQNFFFLQETSVFAPTVSPEWMRTTHFIEGNLLYLKGTDCGYLTHLQHILTATPGLVYIK